MYYCICTVYLFIVALWSRIKQWQQNISELVTELPLDSQIYCGIVNLCGYIPVHVKVSTVCIQ